MSQAAVSGASKIGGAIAGGGRAVFSIFGLFLLKWRVFITVLFLSIYLASAIGESINEKSFKPLVFKVGGRIVSADETQYWKIKEIEANDWRLPSKNIEEGEEEGIWRDIKSLFARAGFAFDTITTLWFIYILWYVLWMALKTINDSARLVMGILAIVFVMFLQALYGVSMLYINYGCSVEYPDLCHDDAQRTKDVGFALTPLKGTYLTVYHLFVTGNLRESFVNSAVPFIERKFINETINQTNFEGTF